MFSSAHFSPLIKVWIIFALIVNYLFVVAGPLWAIPKLRAFGILWTAFMVGIALYNTYFFLIRNRRRWT